MKDILAVIPARYDSQRFPGKVLAPLQEKPLLFYVWRAVRKAKMIDRVIIATDDKQIRAAAEEFGAEVVTTSKRHKCGTDRVAEVFEKVGGQIVLNIQADNFGITPTVLDNVIKKFHADRSADFATLGKRITDDTELFDPNTVKLIASNDSRCLYFSRYPLPYIQNVTDLPRHKQAAFFKHIGIYLFTWRGIRKFAGWQRGKLEMAESLEQLRILENGGMIRLIKTNAKTISVDTPDDLEKITYHNI